MTVRFEKQKENQYQRKYKNINNVISEIGGFTQTLLAIGFLFCSKFSELQLNKEIINEAFNFESDDKLENDQQEQIDQLQPNNTTVIPLINIHSSKINTDSKNQENEKTVLNTKQTLQHLEQQKEQSISSKQHINIMQEQNVKSRQGIQNNIQQSHNQNQASSRPQNTLQVNSQRNQMVQNIVQDQPSQNNIENNTLQSKKRKQIHTQTQFILSQIIQQKDQSQTRLKNNSFNYAPQPQPQTQPQKQTENMISSQQKKEQFVKNQFISMNENKFKKMLSRATNSFTLSIVEYLKYFFWPFGEIKKKKQIIDYSIDKLYYHLDVLYVIKKLLEVDKLKRIIFDQDQLEVFEYLPKPIIKKADVFMEKSKNQDLQYYESEILYQDKRTQIQKTQAACQAFNNIRKRCNNNALDQKLLSHLDTNVLQLFTLNQENEEKFNVDTNGPRNKVDTNNFSSFNSIFKQQEQNNTNLDQRNQITLLRDQGDSLAPPTQENKIKEIDLSLSDIDIPQEEIQQKTQNQIVQDFYKCNLKQ